MTQYLIKFARYNNGETRVSGAQFVSAENFDDAFKIANDRVRGMIAADPISRFYIERIECHRVCAVDCEGGAFMFETVEEFSARLAAQKD